MKTTLTEILKYSPDSAMWVKTLIFLNKTKADDEPIDFMTIREAVGIEIALWCLRTQDYKDYCLFLADVAESVLPIFEAEYPDDKRPRQTIKAIRDWHNGDITKEQLKIYAAAYAATSYAAYTSYAAAAASEGTGYAIKAAVHAAINAGLDWEKIEELFIKHFERNRQ